MEEDSWNEAYRCVIKYSKTTFLFSLHVVDLIFSIVTGGKLDDITVVVGQVVSSWALVVMLMKENKVLIAEITRSGVALKYTTPQPLNFDDALRNYDFFIHGSALALPRSLLCFMHWEKAVWDIHWNIALFMKCCYIQQFVFCTVEKHDCE